MVKLSVNQIVTDVHISFLSSISLKHNGLLLTFLSGNISALFDITFHKIRNSIPRKCFFLFHFLYAPESDFPCLILSLHLGRVQEFLALSLV